MGIFSDMADHILHDMDDAVETIIYTPKGGTATNITAHVFRDPPADDVTRGISLGDMIRIYIAKADIPDVNINSDIVELKRNTGDTTNIKLRVRAIDDQDAGSFYLVLGA